MSMYEHLTPEDRAAGYMLVKLHPKAETVPGKPDAGRIFHEQDDAHPQPNGEVLIVKGRVVKVAPTVRVREALMRHILAEADAPETPAPPSVAELMAAQQAQLVNQNAALAQQNTVLTQQVTLLTAQLTAAGAPLPAVDPHAALPATPDAPPVSDAPDGAKTTKK